VSNGALDALASDYCGDLRLWNASDPSGFRQLLESCRGEARRAPFPVDSEIYTLHSRDPHTPILAAGNLAAPLCIFGRDLGKDEVRHAQPQIGSAGKLVRRGLLTSAGLPDAPDDPHLEAALQHALLSNTVPFKPPGNKAYSSEIKERFRPYVAHLLGCCWQGDRVVTLGTEAFFWFSPYLPVEELREFWAREDRYQAEIACRLEWEEAGCRQQRALTLAPLPHPSPLNRKWLAAFPILLQLRLASSPPGTLSVEHTV
jgi:uracil-DNA glycosylase